MGQMSPLHSFLFMRSHLCLISPLLIKPFRAFIIDGLSVERNHVLVRVGVVGGPSERRLPPRALQEVSNSK